MSEIEITETIAAARAAGEPQAVFAVETVGEMLAIVRDIASVDDPFIGDGMGGEDCLYCRAYYLPEPVEHDPDCLWVRSRRLVAAMEGNDGGMRRL